MRIEFPRHRPAAIRLTPLIDVVFILLVFFLLASSFLDWREFDLALAPAGAAAEADPREPVVVAIDADGALRIDGEAVTADALADRMRQRLGDDPDRPVHVHAADRVPVQRTVRVLDELGAAGAGAVSLREAPQ